MDCSGQETRITVDDVVLFRVSHGQGRIVSRIQRGDTVLQWHNCSAPPSVECEVEGIMSHTELSRIAMFLARAFGCAGVRCAQIDGALARGGWIGFRVV